MKSFTSLEEQPTSSHCFSHGQPRSLTSSYFSENWWRKQLYKRVDVLLDSGAQLSLIRQETAESRRLEGDNISITLTKLRGEEEEVTTKAYKVQVSSSDNKKGYVVKVIGIPTISDDIAKIETKEIGNQLGLKDKIHRGKDIDILIGIHYLSTHTRETKVGDLVARRSPLGWVIFGGQPGDTVSQPDFGQRNQWTWQLSHVNALRGNLVRQRSRRHGSSMIRGRKWATSGWCPFHAKEPYEDQPDNKHQAIKRLETTERTLESNPEHAKAYDNGDERTELCKEA